MTGAYSIALAMLLVASLATVTGITDSRVADAGTFPGVNGRIAFNSDRDGDAEIYSMNADGTGLKRLTESPGNDLTPSWSPDGTRIAFGSARAGNYDIYTMNADGSNITRLTFADGNLHPTWSPDGSKIAFISDRTDDEEIFIMNTDGSGQTRVTNNTVTDFDPSWSPDGSKIAFSNYDEGGIFVINVDGSGLKRLTIDGAEPGWSPDGSEITFSSFRDGNWEIYSMNADGTGQTRLTENPAVDYDASWSPDGTKIAFYTNRNDGNNEIYVMNTDGSGQTRLTENPADDTEPDFGPRSAAQQANLIVNSVDLQNNPLKGMWTVIRAMDGTVIKTGFTPLTFAGDLGVSYKVAVANYDGKVFHHWEDGSTAKMRTITLLEDTALTAYYDTGSSTRGFTPLTHLNPGGPDLTVHAVTLDGNGTLHMWTVIQAGESTASGKSYTIYMHNYKDRVFDHWEDGSEGRVRNLTIEEDRTITAYYRTG